MRPRFFCTSKLQKWTDAGVMRDQLGPFLPRDGECDRSHVKIIASRHPECAARAAPRGSSQLALLLGLTGLVAILWSLKSGQYDDLDGAAVRILADDDIPSA